MQIGAAPTNHESAITPTVIAPTACLYLPFSAVSLTVRKCMTPPSDCRPILPGRTSAPVTWFTISPFRIRVILSPLEGRYTEQHSFLRASAPHSTESLLVVRSRYLISLRSYIVAIVAGMVIDRASAAQSRRAHQ